MGHFGLVSFGGFNIIGIVAPMIDDEVIDALEGEDRELAEAIVARRAEIELPDLAPDYRFRPWRRQFNKNVWKVSVPVARGLYSGGSNSGMDVMVDVNDRLNRLVSQVVRQRPGLYAHWLSSAFGWALRGTTSSPWIAATWLVALFLAAARGLAVRLRSPRQRFLSRESLRWVLGFALLGVGFYLAGLLLVILVEPPIIRYRAVCELFLPSVALAFSGALLREWWSGHASGVEASS